MKPKPEAHPCPCGSARPYLACCGRYHAGPENLQAPSAEALMRSRYSAFVLDQRAYLLETWHPRTRPATIEAPEPGLRWLGLEVKRHTNTGENRAIVEFVARSKLGGKAHRLHETSRFLRVDGRWLYLDGEIDEAGGNAGPNTDAGADTSSSPARSAAG